MTNKEKYAKEILDIACAGDNVAMRKSDNVVLDCKNLKCSDCAFNPNGKGYCNDMVEKWANSEYVESPVDWSKVAVDTPILVKDYECGNWNRGYFAMYKNGTVFTWYHGETSWSAEGDSDITSWRYAKLAESEDV